MSLWGGRFGEAPADALWRFTVSHADRRLLAEDLRGSVAHARMLGRQGILPAPDVAMILQGLADIQAEAAAGEFLFLATDEDVHSAVERRLGERIGEAAGRLHTGRSRNDQVCLDLRLYLRRTGSERIAQLRAFAAVLTDQAEAAGDRLAACYTHLQQAQAVPLAHHLLAYAWMLLRDADRFQDALRRMNVCPLGAGAAAGSSLPLDPASVAEELGFEAAFDNSLDAVASRDFAAEYGFCCAQAMAHLSRLAEELVLWATSEFGWATYADRFTTGSSALPQKKNPDIAELARGRAARVTGDLVTLLGIQKGLPLAYNRDLQEDKEALFSADDTLSGALEALGGMLASATLHPPPPSPFTVALDLAELLVARGLPFRQAHHTVGRLVRRLQAEGRTPADLAADELAAAHPLFQAADVTRLSPAASVAARRVPGGASMDSVRDQIARLRTILAD
ncbi:MAG TPA: argininosuccinate lyase [Anaerolineae bacterium]|nr:argininosuccinate lyase [Anaerolineae bacterium]